ncbi:ATPase [Thermosinus carboxydivorans Nor1]|uniref:ATPase n=1 Tax=Thermosinus carboxydivorans Nor1 TaxID=401526 RepID=A1HS32_9FIRM|nr:PRK06851 family protein [Thermosinus carboxydivorans]EAX47207.1 ATPase [Thermosinus carboxydivorans Nor1]
MLKGKVKHVFPGGNTPYGFFSYYDYIISSGDAARIFVIKGGPGVGKSTFMRKMGDVMTNRGYDVEFHHCSSDNNSLDGVVIPALRVAFIDGTAPHVVDPKHPGGVDEILHLGDFWDEAKMVANKQAILNCTSEISKLFQRAYRVLRAAKSLYDDWEAVNTDALNPVVANQKAAELINEIFGGISGIGAGKVRKLFASAITPEGPVNYLDSVVGAMNTRYIVTGEPGTGKATLLQKVVDTAVAKGLDVEAYYCPLAPQKVEHVLIPALNVGITTVCGPHAYKPSDARKTINMNECLKPQFVAKRAAEKAFAQETYQTLFAKAVAYINQAKKLHDTLETYYVPNMDFAGVQKLWEKTRDRVLAYANK